MASNKRKDIFNAIDNAENNAPSKPYGGVIQEEFFENIKETSVDDARVQELTSQLEEATERLIGMQQRLTSSIIPADDGSFYFLGFQMTRTRLIAPEETSDDDLAMLGYVFSKMDDALQFWIGDWANILVGDEAVDQVRGEMYERIAKQFDLNPRTLRNYASVCRKLPVSLRRDTVGFSVHREIAEIPEGLKGREEYFLDWAEANKPVTVAKIKEIIASTLAEIRGVTTSITEDSFLLASKDIPKVNAGFKSMWAAARNGNEKAKRKLREKIERGRKWLDEVEESLED